MINTQLEQDTLRMSEIHFRRLFEAAREGILILDAVTLRITDANPFMTELLSYSRDEFLGKELWEIGLFRDKRSSKTAINDLKEKGYLRYENLPLKTTTGKLRQVEFVCNVYKEGGQKVIQCNIRDITERMLAEKERRVIFEIIQGVNTTRNLAEFLKLIHHSIGQVIYAKNCFVMLNDPEDNMNHFEFWVDKYNRVPPPRLISKGFSGYVLQTGVPLLLSTESLNQMCEQTGAERNGTAAASWLGVPLRTPTRTIGVLALQHYENQHAYSERDLEFLTSVGDEIALAIELKRADEAIKSAEEKYRSIFENAVEGIFQSTRDGRFTSVNPAMAHILGYASPAELIAERTDIGTQHYVEMNSRSELKLMLAEQDIVLRFESEVFRKDMTKIWTQENIRAIRDDDGALLHYEGTIEDVTAYKLLEDQLRQSQKMEAIGLLAGGIAHDFNNLLTAISGYSDLTLKRMPLDEPLRRNIEEIKDAGKRAAGLTSQLLAFSRKQVLQPRVHNVNSIITDLERMLRRIIRENIEFKIVLDPELGNIKADPGQIEQVIMNLVVNARDAMPNGGTLTIETRNLDEAHVSQNVKSSPGSFVNLIVTDTGEGMDEPTQKRIFEPFFTTKDVGKGTGLGLSMVYGIVNRSGGDIIVDSQPGHGTSFIIYLPRNHETVRKTKGSRASDDSYAGEETILLVEDEAIVRNLVREILTSKGYKVLDAASGKAALSICNSYSQPIHLLLSDVIMPKMSGVELKDRVIKVRPEIKLLFMSGYADDSITQTGILNTHTAFIEKPFTPDGLTRRIREVLET